MVRGRWSTTVADTWGTASGMAMGGKLDARATGGQRTTVPRTDESEGSATQDERHREEKKIQALTDEFAKKIDDLIQHKEEEILQV